MMFSGGDKKELWKEMCELAECCAKYVQCQHQGQ